MMEKPTILIIGTLDTKAPELHYLYTQILQSEKCSAKVLDVGRTPSIPIDSNSTPTLFPKDAVIPILVDKKDQVLSRGEHIASIIATAVPIARNLVSNSQIQGIVSAGGSCGTSIGTAIMRGACPIGFPKVMVSTMASGDIKHYVEETDITIMASVVDVAGMNSILEGILGNAAAAVVGMTVGYGERLRCRDEDRTRGGGGGKEVGTKRKRIAITMFGVTTPCVDKIRDLLEKRGEDRYEVYVFHATGSGGKAMERLVSEGQIDAVIDLTTTEIADELFGGVLSAGPRRLEATASSGIPFIVSVGAVDMVNFGPMDTSVPEEYRRGKGRNLVQHNPAVTLMRTDRREGRMIGEFIAGKLERFASKPENVKVMLPVGGVSMLDCEGQPFHDPEADEAVFEAIEDGLRNTDINVRRVRDHINDESFAEKLVEEMEALMS